ncbi:unnamed protein product [Amoebophrya sp. A120]|nr:unnamed protein product [Amoebophrya sp. A120]|eukprot:GSA120T00009885001.1
MRLRVGLFVPALHGRHTITLPGRKCHGRVARIPLATDCLRADMIYFVVRMERACVSLKDLEHYAWAGCLVFIAGHACAMAAVSYASAQSKQWRPGSACSRPTPAPPFSPSLGICPRGLPRPAAGDIVCLYPSVCASRREQGRTARRSRAPRPRKRGGKRNGRWGGVHPGGAFLDSMPASGSRRGFRPSLAMHRKRAGPAAGPAAAPNLANVGPARGLGPSHLAGGRARPLCPPAPVCALIPV